MKMVIAVIQPTKLDAVREALTRLEVNRMTVCDAQGFARQRGQSEMYRGHEYTSHLLRKVELQIVVNDDFLERLAPNEPHSQYRHNRTGEDNGDAHIKRQFMGREVVVAVTNGKLDFGPWEQIFYGEFDGRRRKRVLVKIIGE